MSVLQGGGSAGSGFRMSRFTTSLVIVQIALSAALVTAAGVMTRSALLTFQTDIGADVTGFLSARVLLPNEKYSDEDRVRFFDRLVTELRAKPTVNAVAAATGMPGTFSQRTPYELEGMSYDDPPNAPQAQLVRVVPGFFKAFDRSLLRGRDFDSRDRPNAVPVAIVNGAFVQKNFAGVEPIGQRIRVGGADAPLMTIVAVAPNMQHGNEWAPGGSYSPAIYTPVGQRPPQALAIAVKGGADVEAYATLIRNTVHALDSDLAVFDLHTIEDEQVSNHGPQRVFASALAAFAIIAVALTAAGIYCVLAFTTNRRNREIGVRRALGAPDRTILVAVLRGAVLQLVVGLAVGSPLSLLVPRVLRTSLHGMPPDEPVIYTLVFVVLTLTAVAASWLPVRRALRVSPAVALRDE